MFNQKCSTFSIKPEYHCMPTASLAWLYLLPMDPQTVPSTTLSCQYHQQLLQYDCTVRSSTSLILTDLLTRGQNYSFAVAAVALTI